MHQIRAKAAAAALKEIIERDGTQKLRREPQEVYEKLQSAAGDYTARLLFLALLSGVLEQVEVQGADAGEVRDFLVQECGLRQEVAQKIAGILAQVLSPENVTAWDEKTDAGFRELCAGQWEIEAENENSCWHHDGVHVDCSYEAGITFKVEKPEVCRAALAPYLDRHPFATAEELRQELERHLQSALDAGFEEYCGPDDYYPPVPEDYDFEDEVMNPFCEKYGLSCVDYYGNGSGADSYEPDDDDWGYRGW